MSPTTLLILVGVAAGFAVLLGMVARYLELPGPLFWFELIRVTRKGLHARFRVIFGLILLICLYLLYISWFPSIDPMEMTISSSEVLGLKEMAKFAEAFFLIFLEVQMVAVVLLTPAYTAGSIIEEKQRRTLELLLAVGMTSNEIVLGKLAARLTQIAGILLAGLPILMLSMFFGGVDLTIMITAYLGTFATMFAFAGVSMATAVTSPTLGKALTETYTFFFLGYLMALGACVGIFVLPFSYVAFLFQVNDPGGGMNIGPWALCGVYVFLHGLTGLIGLVIGISRFRRHVLGLARIQELAPRRLRQRAPFYTKPHDPYREEKILTIDRADLGIKPQEEKEAEVELVLVNEPVPRRPRRKRIPKRPWRVSTGGPAIPVGTMEPLFWKERFFGQGGRPDRLNLMGPWMTILLTVAACIIALTIALTFAAIGYHKPTGEIYNPLIKYIGGMFTVGLVIVIGSHVVATVAREREQQTLEPLLMLPGDRLEILRAKLLGAWYRFRWALLCWVILVATGLPSGGLHPFALFPVLALGLSTILFSACLAIWLSVRCQNTMRASIFWGLTLIALVGLPPMAGMLVESLLITPSGYYSDNHSVNRWYSEMVRAVSPVLAWDASTFFWQDLDSRLDQPVEMRVLKGMLASVIMFVSALLLWIGAKWRFEREGKT